MREWEECGVIWSGIGYLKCASMTGVDPYVIHAMASYSEQDEGFVSTVDYTKGDFVAIVVHPICVACFRLLNQTCPAGILTIFPVERYALVRALD